MSSRSGLKGRAILALPRWMQLKFGLLRSHEILTIFKLKEAAEVCGLEIDVNIIPKLTKKEQKLTFVRYGSLTLMHVLMRLEWRRTRP
jgi:hypothetical protein